MALVKKLGVKNKPVVERQRVVLPEEPNEPSDRLADYSILLYGAKKIGKTTLAAEFPNPFVMATEPGTKALRIRAGQVRSFEEALGTVDALEAKFKAGEKYCATVAVDTVDLLYEQAFAWICRKKGIKHPHDVDDYGMTWKEIRAAFRDLIVRILRLPCGVIFISHDAEKEIELSDGSKIDRTQPTMAGQALQEIEGIVDIIAHYGFERRLRALRIRGMQEIVAGSRLREHFLVKGGKPENPADRVELIPCGETSRDTFRALMRAFNNEQPTTALPLSAKPKLTLKKHQ